MSLWDLVRIAPGSTVVNVGYGIAEELITLSEKVGSGVIYGVEPDERLVSGTLKQLSDRPNIRVMVGKACAIPLPDNSVDFVVLKGVLHEVEDVPAALSEARRVCARDGRIVVFDFAAFPLNWLRWSNLKWRVSKRKIRGPPIDKHPGFSSQSLTSYLNDAGLRMESYQEEVARGSFGGHDAPMFLLLARMDEASVR